VIAPFATGKVARVAQSPANVAGVATDGVGMSDTASSSPPHADSATPTQLAASILMGVVVMLSPLFMRVLANPAPGHVKSVTNALTGILVRQGRLDVNALAPISAWADMGDPRFTWKLIAGAAGST
jgi:hypothetical protein